MTELLPRNPQQPQPQQGGRQQRSDLGVLPYFETPAQPQPSPQYKNTAPEETVESRLTNLLKKDNPYLADARARGERSMAARGGQNSSLWAGAGETAAIQSALPVAQQDAGFYQQKNLAGQQGEIESYLSGQQAQQQAGLYKVQGDITQKLQTGQFSHDSQMQREKLAHDMKVQYGQNAHDMAMKNIDVEWNKIDLNARTQVEYDRLDEDRKTSFNTTATQIAEEYQKYVMEIFLNPNLKTDADRQAAIDRISQITQQRMDIASKVAKLTYTWEPTKNPWGTKDAPTNPKDAATPPKATPAPEKEGTKKINKLFPYKGSDPRPTF